MAEKDQQLQAAAPASTLARYTSVLPPDPAEMVHELASPFSAITLQLESLETQLKCCDHCQTYVTTQVQPTLSQLRSIHTLMQTYLHQEVKEVAECNVHQMVRSMLLLLQPLASKTDVEIIYDRKNALWWPTRSYQLRQVLLNLMNNALEAYARNENAPHRQIQIETLINNNSLEIVIRDWAGGIANLHAPHGHGIGLQQVEEYLFQLHGSLTILKLPGQGTMVNIRL